MGNLSACPYGQEGEAGRVISLILEAIGKVRFGQVVIFIQNGKVIQIDKTEKVRIEREGTVRALCE